MLIEDLLRLVWIADPQISPDGRRIAFTRVTVDADADEYVTSLWLADVAGGDPRPLTHGRIDSQPRWSPDGRRLAFVRGTEPGKPCQIHVLSLEGGEPVRLTELPEGASEPCWSPDGKQLAFLSGSRSDGSRKPDPPKNAPARVVTRPEFRWNGEGFTDLEHLDHVWVVDATGGTPRALTAGPFKDENLRWSRDGRWLLFTSDRRREPWHDHEDCDLWAVSPDRGTPAADEELVRVADIRGPIRAWTEDAGGRILAVGAPLPETSRSYDQGDLLLFEGEWPRTRPRVLTAGYDFEIGDGITSDTNPPRGGGAMPLAFVEEGRAALCVAGREGAARLARVALDGGRVEELTDAAHTVIGGSVSADGRRVALTLGNLERPGDLCVYDLGTGTLSVLWRPNEALFAERTLGEVEEIRYPSFDGRMIQGWIVKPPDFDPGRKYPFILQIHGGPHAAYGVAFFHEFRQLAAAGYVVLATNPRGSTTYGQDFGNVIQYRYPGDDYRDLMAGVDAVVARGYVDEERMGVTGGSGGGLLTNWVVAHTDRFKAAITQRCVSEWISFWYSADFTMFRPSWFRKAPHEDPQEYLERSPVMLASRIVTPLMVIHSEEDWRTPIGQGEAMFRALKQQGKQAVMVRFPGENHELSRSGAPSRRLQNQRHIRAWFDKHLLGQPVPEYDA